MATLVIDETPLKVTSVQLMKGSIVICVRHEGALPEKPFGRKDVALHGDDGMLIVSGHINTGWPEMFEGNTFDIQWNLWPHDRRLNAESAL